MENESCGNCVFWAESQASAANGESDKPRSGICRRYPPSVHLVPVVAAPASPLLAAQEPRTSLAWNAQFPPMLNLGWCGEWATDAEPAVIETDDL